MSIRRNILMLVAPLFLLLAGVNGALLYALERAEAARGLSEQAVAAAVTTAAFTGGKLVGNLDDLADPRRAAALRAAAANIPGLAGLYVGEGEAAPVRIAGSGAAEAPGRYDPPSAPLALPVDLTAEAPLAVAVAAAGGDRYVVAQIDARPLAAQIETLRRLVFGLLAAGGLLGLGLGWMVAGRIAREVRANAAMVAAIRAGGDVDAADVERLTLRETAELAHAVRLMKTGVDGRLARADRELAMRDRGRDAASSAAAVQAESFPSLDTRAGGAAVAIRGLGRIDPGQFHAVADRAGSALVVLGVCGGEAPADRLANALAARAFFERTPAEDDAAARIETGRRAFAVERIAWSAWTQGEATPAALSLLDEESGRQAQVYLARSGALPAAAVADDLVALLAADGALAVVKPSGQG